MRPPQFVVLCFLSLLMMTCADAFAGQQKKTKIVAQPKPIYEEAMRVVVVSNRFPTCEPDCPQWISAEGEITAATPTAFRRVFKQIGSKNMPLVIRSPGGSIEAAIEIGKMVRKRNMTVAVGYTLYRGCRPDEVGCKLSEENKGIYSGSIAEFQAFCNSACPMILAAGTTRLASSVVYLGLHEPKTLWTREWVKWRDAYKVVNGKKKFAKRTIISRKLVKGKTTYGFDKRLRKQLGNYYKSMGIDLAILDEMEKAKYKDMYWLPEYGRDKLHLRTSVGSAASLGAVRDFKPTVRPADECTINGSKYVGEICTSEKAKSVAVVAKPTGPEMTIQLARLAEPLCATQCPSWIVLDGRITSKTPALFEAFVRTLGHRHFTVVLNSQGGELDAAMRLGRTIRQLRFDTTIGKTLAINNGGNNETEFKATVSGPGFCRGSCLLSFVGGVARHVDLTSDFQVQSPFLDIEIGKVQLQQAQMERHIDYMGADSAFVFKLPMLMDSTGQGVVAKYLLTYRIATDTKNASALFDWQQGDAANEQ
jgi:hypothetical protein